MKENKVVTDVVSSQYINAKHYKCTDCGDISYITHNTDKYNDIYCCSKMDSTTHRCVLGNGTKGDPSTAILFNSDDHTVECLYDRTKLDSLSQVYKAKKLFGTDNAVRDAFCQSNVETCPFDPNLPFLAGCSRYISSAKNKDYKYCSEILNNLKDAERDAAIFNYCSRYNTDDCKCFNRMNDKDFMRLKQGNPFPDSCWYKPCVRHRNNLTPSEFNKDYNCPKDVCQIVYNIAQQHGINLDYFKRDIDCDFTQVQKKSSYLWYILITIIVAIISLIIYNLI